MLAKLNIFSETLKFPTDLYVMVPTPVSDDYINGRETNYLKPDVKFQLLYLLHGAYGNHSDWLRYTNIERYAREHKLVVVMPDASNSFYQNMYYGSAYLSYLTDELPRVMQQMFPVSLKRENTFVAGLSMGGYGAVRSAFERPDLFGYCASLSGALDIVSLINETAGDRYGNGITDVFKWNNIFEHPDQVAGSDADLLFLIKKRMQEGKMLPAVCQMIGREDFLYRQNRAMKEKMEAMGVELHYREYEGTHDWEFWDHHIQDVLRWLPLTNNPVME